MEAETVKPERPFWVRFGLWGLSTRASALMFCWLCVLIAAAATVYSLWDPRFFAGALLGLAALWYWLAIRWVDQHGGWSSAGKGPRAKLWAWALPIALGGLTVLIITVFIAGRFVFFGYYQIPQNGMYPGLPAGSRVFALRHPYESPSEVKRGDIVIFTRTEGRQEYLYVWRVIGLPGDAVQVSGETVTVDGQPLQRQKVRSDGDMIIQRETNGDATYEVAYDMNPPAKPPPEATLTVPAAHFFVLGDNRNHAVDSRYFGPIPFDSIIARKW
jgi:signal peptidase I